MNPSTPKTRQAITDFLFVSDVHEPVDFAFVLGSPSLTSIEPAIELFHKGFTQTIFISGLGPQNSQDRTAAPEAQILQSHAIACGVPQERMVIETQSTNTLENFQFSAKLIEKHFGWSNIRRIAICGKPFHMRRALMTAKAQWPSHVTLLMTPSNHPDDPNAHTWWQSAIGRAIVLREINAISIYAMKGHIGDF